MSRKLALLFMSFTMLSVEVFAQSTEGIYAWESPQGDVIETGGSIEQHNFLFSNRINYVSSNYYTIQLCGKKENMYDKDNSINSVYFTINLAENTFKEGDKIVITAMRNNDDGGSSNIHFVYGNGTIVDDNNTWANLGQLHETSFSGGIEAKKQSSTEPITGYDIAPSTNEFIVPAQAEGSTTLSLTRNESECKLYITKIEINRNTTASAISITEQKQKDLQTYNLSGLRTNYGYNGIVIQNGKKYIQ